MRKRWSTKKLQHTSIKSDRFETTLNASIFTVALSTLSAQQQHRTDSARGLNWLRYYTSCAPWIFLRMTDIVVMTFFVPLTNVIVVRAAHYMYFSTDRACAQAANNMIPVVAWRTPVGERNVATARFNKVGVSLHQPTCNTPFFHPRDQRAHNLIPSVRQPLNGLPVKL